MLFITVYAVSGPLFRIDLPQSADCGNFLVWIYERQKRGHVDWILLRKSFFPDDIKLPLFLISASDFCYNILVYLFLFFLRGRFQFGYYLLHIILPELVYTILITIVLYFIILKINQKLESIEKRSASKFV